MLFSESKVKQPVNILIPKCGVRQVQKLDRFDQPIYDSAGRFLTHKVEDTESNFIIRVLPHATHNDTRISFWQQIAHHKDEQGMEHLCSGANCKYCKDNHKSIINYFCVCYLQSTNTSLSSGIYVLKANMFLKRALDDFSNQIQLLNIDGDFVKTDYTSAFDNGCFIKISVYKTEFTPYPQYKIEKVSVNCPIHNKIRNDYDLLEWAKSNNCPDLEGYIAEVEQKAKRTDYCFKDVSNSFLANSDDTPDLFRDFNPSDDIVLIENMFEIKTDDDFIKKSSSTDNTEQGIVEDVCNVDLTKVEYDDDTEVVNGKTVADYRAEGMDEDKIKLLMSF